RSSNVAAFFCIAAPGWTVPRQSDSAAYFGPNGPRRVKPEPTRWARGEPSHGALRTALSQAADSGANSAAMRQLIACALLVSVACSAPPAAGGRGHGDAPTAPEPQPHAHAQRPTADHRFD